MHVGSSAACVPAACKTSVPLVVFFFPSMRIDASIEGKKYRQCMTLGQCMEALAYTDDAHGPADFPGTNTNG